MLQRLKNLLIGVALVLLAIWIDRRMENAASRTALEKGEDGASTGHPTPRRKLLPRILIFIFALYVGCFLGLDFLRAGDYCDWKPRCTLRGMASLQAMRVVDTFLP